MFALFLLFFSRLWNLSSLPLFLSFFPPTTSTSASFKFPQVLQVQMSSDEFPWVPLSSMSSDEIPWVPLSSLELSWVLMSSFENLMWKKGVLRFILLFFWFFLKCFFYERFHTQLVEYFLFTILTSENSYTCLNSKYRIVHTNECKEI